VERIVEEVPVAIAYNGQAHVVMMATPADLEDFALGFSLTEELLSRPDEFQAVDVIRYSRGIELQVAVAPERDAVIAERNRRLTAGPDAASAAPTVWMPSCGQSTGCRQGSRSAPAPFRPPSRAWPSNRS